MIAKAIQIAEEIQNVNFPSPTQEDIRSIIAMIDFTSLNEHDTIASIDSWSKNALLELDKYKVACAAYCVFPNFIEILRENIGAQNKLAVVNGNFPSGMTLTQIKVEEAVLSEALGADEIDTVINKGWAREESWKKIQKEIYTIKGSLSQAHLKVILETGELDPEQIWQASQAAMRGGADFIKTSTGKTQNGASLEAIAIMSLCAREFYQESGRKVGIKASGGIATVEDAQRYMEVIQMTLGSQWLQPSLFRIGASRLLSNCLKGMGE